MKILNILIAGLSLAALTGCSKDNSPVNVVDLPNAKLNLTLKASGPSSTKADDDDNALEGEANVNSVAVLTFTADGTSILSDPYWNNQISTSSGVSSVTSVPTKATNALIAVLANVPEDAFSGVTNYTQFQGRLAQLVDQKQTNLAMSTQIIAASQTLTDGDNYIGYATQTNINNINSPIELTRLSARVELVSLKTNFVDKVSLAGRTMQINNIRLVNRKTASHFASTDYWGVVMAEGNLGNSDATALNVSVKDGSPVSNSGYRQYVMENLDADNATQIVINATLLASPGYQAETKEFAATINVNGITGTNAHKYIKRNYIYRLNITFNSGSFEGVREEDPTPPTPPTPETGSLTVNVEVVGWGPVNQNAVVK